VVFGAEFVNGRIFPPPPGLDFANREAMRAAMAQLPPTALLLVLVGWVLGSVTGGFVAAIFGGPAAKRNALFVGVGLMTGGIFNLLTIPHPLWFAIAALLLFLPSAWLGARLAGARSGASVETAG
jgi:hypothetical protein